MEVEEGNQSTLPTPSSEPEQKVCPYYLKGTCRQLTNCKWLHPAEAGSPQLNPDSKLCPYYATGRCNHGNSCKWIHPISPKEQMCPHFAVGKCFYGNNCKYKHPGQMNNLFYGIGQPMPSPYDPPLMMNMAPFNPMMMNHGMPNMPFARFTSSDEKKICKYWQEGNCHFENCRFPHIGPAGGGLTVHPQFAQMLLMTSHAKPVEQDTSGKVCRYWAQGSCHFEHCRFPHVGPAGSTVNGGGGVDPTMKVTDSL